MNDVLDAIAEYAPFVSYPHRASVARGPLELIGPTLVFAVVAIYSFVRGGTLLAGAAAWSLLNLAYLTWRGYRREACRFVVTPGWLVISTRTGTRATAITDLMAVSRLAPRTVLETPTLVARTRGGQDIELPVATSAWPRLYCAVRKLVSSEHPAPPQETKDWRRDRKHEAVSFLVTLVLATGAVVARQALLY